ncbi:uncharacterized protein M421DRAFT_343572 [Didymella exigua CBS 183.55]|uniref:Uncharacterized protein n=1 Tax=Didymella exigua CBS 183.55 TaxID=1150837 RepID=A0A6A5RTV6_9PLEO|nr:uncharacterized protein M421DRAFT_343572 [Didymella exigua CBS 183.55]KAF1931292.1 hypothetical protein M421DRAFT_343572 [Didymella exigua CBS 183.55]
MKLYINITLLLAALLNFAYTLPAGGTDLSVPIDDTVALIDPTDRTSDTLTINGTTALSAGILTRDPVSGICQLNIGLVEHFPRGGTTGGRRASIFVGALMDGASKDVWWRWDSGESGYPNGRTTERRIDNYTIRIYDLTHPGDSLGFRWVHPDNNCPEDEWMDFNFNGVKWNDRARDCARGNCCKTGPFYGDGKDRMIRGIGCAFHC